MLGRIDVIGDRVVRVDILRSMWCWHVLKRGGECMRELLGRDVLAGSQRLSLRGLRTGSVCTGCYFHFMLYLYVGNFRSCIWCEHVLELRRGDVSVRYWGYQLRVLRKWDYISVGIFVLLELRGRSVQRRGIVRILCRGNVLNRRCRCLHFLRPGLFPRRSWSLKLLSMQCREVPCEFGLNAGW